jgi:DNA-directed RNA polymerase subunit E'/Rpb7
LQDRVKIIPSLLGKNLDHVISSILRKKYEAKCSQYGYIQQDTITIYKYSMGSIVSPSLNGDIQFTVQFYANVFNPIVGQIVRAKVVNANKFGVLAECESFIEIIIAKNTSTLASDIDLNAVSIGDMINVEILGKKYELNDKRISIVGRAVQDIATTVASTSKIRKISRVVEKTADELGDDPDIDDEEDDDEEDEDDEEEEDDEEDDADDEVDEDVVEEDEDEDEVEDEKEDINEEFGEDLDADDDIGGDDLEDNESLADDI